MSNSCSFEFQQCFKCCYHLALPPIPAIYCLPVLVICVCTGRQRKRIRCSIGTVLLSLSHLNLIHLTASTALEKLTLFRMLIERLHWKSILVCVHKYTPFPGCSLKLIPHLEMHLKAPISQNQFWWVNKPEGGWFQQNSPLKLHGVGSGSSSRKFWSFSSNQLKLLQMLLQSFPMWHTQR